MEVRSKSSYQDSLDEVFDILESVLSSGEEEDLGLIEILAEAVRELEDVDSFLSIAITGMQGAGKTCTALHLLHTLTGSWEEALNLLFFYPIELLDRSREVKYAILDDAGVALSKYFITREKELFVKYYNIIRTRLRCLVFTFVGSSLFKFLREFTKVRVLIRRVTRREASRYGLGPEEYKRYCVARLYYVYMRPDYTTGIKRVGGEYVYDFWVPDDIYNMYNVRREEVVRDLEEELREQLVSEGLAIPEAMYPTE